MKQHLQQQGRLYSCLVNGTRHDIGTPYVYWKSLQAIYDSNYDIDCHKGNSHLASSSSDRKNSKTFHGQRRNFNSVASDLFSASSPNYSQSSTRSKVDTSCTTPHPLEPEESIARALLQWLQNIESSSSTASATPPRTDIAATVTAGTVGVRSYSSHAELNENLHSLSDKSNEGPMHFASSPGRIDLLGGFADYNGSHLLQHSTSQRCYAFAKFTNSHNDILMQTIQVPSIQEILSQRYKSIQDLIMYKKTIPLSSLLAHPNQIQKSSQINLISKSELRLLLESKMLDFIPKHEQLWPSYLIGVVHALLQHADTVGLNVPLSVDEGTASFKVDNGSFTPSLTAATAVKHLNNFSGIEIKIVSDVPWNSGLASSAAVEMSVAMAMSRAMGFTSSTMSVNEMALMCQAVENEVVGANCGLMDQLTVANLPNRYSDQYVRGQMHEMQQKPIGETQRSGLVGTEIHDKRLDRGQINNSSILSLCCKLPLTVPPCVSFSLPSDMSVIAMESGVLRSVADAPYRQVRVASMMGMTIINNNRTPSLSSAPTVKQLKYLCDVSLEEFNTEYRNLLPDTMTGREFVSKHGHQEGTMKNFSPGDIDLNYDYRILSSTSHPIEENNRVLQFESLLRNYSSYKNGDENKNESRDVDVALGNLMAESHKSYSDCGLGTAPTDHLVSLLNKNHGIIGAKISGGGGGGSISVLIKNVKDSTLNNPQLLADIPSESDSPPMLDITPKTAAFLDDVKERYFKETGLHCTIRTGRSGPLKYLGFSSRSFSVSSMSSDSSSSIAADNVEREDIRGNDSDSIITSTTHLSSSGTDASCDSGSNVNSNRDSADITTNYTSNNYNTKTAAISNAQKEKMSGITDPPKSRILIVNHGYPPAFNGGSEVYSQTLALHLLESQQFSAVSVMAREHDPFREDYEMRVTVDESNPLLPVYLLNYPREAAYYQFLSTSIDNSFRTLLQQLQPNIVHFHHLNHLSLNLPKIAKDEFNAKVVYTLHDYWLMCPRGQFLVTGTTSKDRREPWQQCTGQNDRKCAVDCYTNRYSGGDVSSEENDLIYWTDWIKRRMAAVREACTYVDAFIAPSKYLEKKFVDQFSIPDHKMVYHPYGFDRNRLVGRKRVHNEAKINNTSMCPPSISTTDGSALNRQCLSIANNEISTPAASADNLIKDCENEDLNFPYVFAYIGRHQPSKGINLLVDAALHLIAERPALLGKFIVKIYGRADMNATSSLKRKITEALPEGLDSQVFQVSVSFLLNNTQYA